MTEKILYTPREVELLCLKGEVVLIDIREEEIYALGHIPQAVNMPEIFHYLGTSTPAGLNEMHRTFQSLFAKAGVTAEVPVIFYEESMDSRYGSSCRGYWLLTYLGHPKAGILDGGFIAWEEESMPVDALPVTPKPEWPIREMNSPLRTFRSNSSP